MPTLRLRAAAWSEAKCRPFSVVGHVSSSGYKVTCRTGPCCRGHLGDLPSRKTCPAVELASLCWVRGGSGSGREWGLSPALQKLPSVIKERAWGRGCPGGGR